VRTIEVRELSEGQLPVRPTMLKKFDAVVGTYEAEVLQRLENGKTVVIGGLSLVGEKMYIVPSIGIMQLTEHKPEGAHLKGWALHLGHPDEKFRKLCYFDTSQSVEDVELPLPNYLVYFACEIDPEFNQEDVDAEVLMRIAQFVLPFISDSGPPKDIDW